MNAIAAAITATALVAPAMAAAAPVTAVLSVAGLDCNSWPLAVRATKGVQVERVTVDVDRRRLRINFDDAAVDTSQLVQALQRGGFTARVVRQTSRPPDP